MRSEEIAYRWYGDKTEFLDVGRYPDGSPYVKEAGHLAVEGVERVLLRPRDSAGFLGGLFWVQSIIERGVRPPELIIPCMFGQRQDRINSDGDVLFTIKSVAKIVNSLGCPQVTVFDPHSEAVAASIDRCRVIHAVDIFAEAAAAVEYRAVIAPDAGSAKRAGAVAKFLGVPLKQGFKKRDTATGALSGFGVEDLSDLFRDNEAEVGSPDVPHVLVVDDLCDGGGTFVGLGQELDAAGVDSDLFVTHGLFTKGTQGLHAWYQNIICSDSVVTQRSGVQIVQAAETVLCCGGL